MSEVQHVAWIPKQIYDKKSQKFSYRGIHPLVFMHVLPLEQAAQDHLRMGAGAHWVAEASSYDTARRAALCT